MVWGHDVDNNISKHKLQEISFCVTNDHGYFPPVVNTSRSCLHSRPITGFVTSVTRWMPLLQQELLSLPEHLSPPPVFSWVHVTLSFVFGVLICRSLFVLFHSFGHCVVCPFSFIWLLCCLSFSDLLILITPLVTSNSSCVQQCWCNLLHRATEPRGGSRGVRTRRPPP